MNLTKKFSLAIILLLLNLNNIVSAKDINGLSLASSTIPLNNNATLILNFSKDSSFCGATIDWGNGARQDIRLGIDNNNSPAVFNLIYSNPGTFNIKVDGKGLRRGITFAEPCTVSASPISLKVTDPVAEKLAAEKLAAEKMAAEKMAAEKFAAETLLKQAEIKLQQASVKEQSAIEAAEKIKQDLLRQQDAERSRELEYKRKELELREAILKKEEEAKRASLIQSPNRTSSNPVRPSTADSLTVSPSNNKPPVKPVDGF